MKLMLNHRTRGFSSPCVNLTVGEKVMRKMSDAYKIHKLINRERRKRGLNPAYWSGELAKLARSQAWYCAKRRKLVHSDRYAFQGGENLAMIGGRFNSKAPVSCWLGSKGHREYMLSSRVTKAGVGVAKSRGNTYVAWAFSDEFNFKLIEIKISKFIKIIKNLLRKQN